MGLKRTTRYVNEKAVVRARFALKLTVFPGYTFTDLI